MKSFLRSVKFARRFEDCYPLGNGSIGIMDNGNPEKNTIVLNDEGFWSGSDIKTEGKKGGMSAVKDIRKALLEKDLTLAEKLVKEHIAGEECESYIPLGKMIIEKGWGTFRDYERILDLDNSVMRVSYTLLDKRYSEESFVSFPDKVFVKNIKVSKKSIFKIAYFSHHPSRYVLSDNIVYVLGRAPSHVVYHDIPSIKPIIYDKNHPGMPYALALKVDTDGEFTYYLNDGIRIINATYVTLYYSSATGYDTKIFQDNVIEGVDIAQEKLTISKEVLSASDPLIFSNNNIAGNDRYYSEKNATELEDVKLKIAQDETLLGNSGGAPATLPVADCFKRLEKYLAEIIGKAHEKGYYGCLKSHIDDYKNLYDRVVFELNDVKESPIDLDKALRKQKEKDALIVTLYNFNRYLMISSSRERSLLPANLQGIWSGAKRPFWSSGYTMNINFQMNYWAVMSANLSECSIPFINFVKTLSEKGKKTAEEIFGCQGFALGHNSDAHFHTSPVGGDILLNSSSYSLSMCTAGWLANQLFDFYFYNLDEAMLTEYVLPVAREAVAFYLDYLYEDKDGNICVGPDISPENAYIYSGSKFSIDSAPAITMAVIRELFDNYAKYGKDIEIITKINKLLGKLPRYEITTDGRIAEWSNEYMEAQPSHRHLSHLYGLYPGKEIVGSIELCEAAEKSLKQRGDGGTGWSLAWKICLYARLKKAEKAYEMLVKQLAPVRVRRGEKGGSYFSLLSAHPPFQIDGNFGTLAGINEMLVQCCGEKVEFLPALPTVWEKGSISGLRIHENKVVEISWAEGKVVMSHIKDM